MPVVYKSPPKEQTDLWCSDPCFRWLCRLLYHLSYETGYPEQRSSETGGYRFCCLRWSYLPCERNFCRNCDQIQISGSQNNSHCLMDLHLIKVTGSELPSSILSMIWWECQFYLSLPPLHASGFFLSSFIADNVAFFLHFQPVCVSVFFIFLSK